MLCIVFARCEMGIVLQDCGESIAEELVTFSVEVQVVGEDSGA